jgi:serine/threonine protein kinase
MTSSRGGSRAGEMFGPYELRSLIGAGGMGEVYQAYDTVKDRVIAVKLLRREFAADPSFQERFRRESRVAARLQGPHVIPVHDFGEINGVLYIDMRFVEGRDLKTVLAENGPLDPPRATSIVAQVAAALDAAHACGLVHRDVKPENVLLNRDDFAYLVDFGIAHLGGETGLTSAGTAIGSCAYMAPERFTGGQVGPAADIYSLACLLYECLTGQPPFPVGNVTALMSAHILSPPPRPSATRPGLETALDGVIAWGMAKDPAARCSSAGELARTAGSAAASALSSSRAAASWDTRESAGQWSDLEVTRDAQRDYVGESGTGSRGGGFGRRALVLAASAAAVLAAAILVLVLWLASGEKRSTTPANPPASSTETTSAPGAAENPTAAASPPTSPPQISLPGTDAQGFVDYRGARCDLGSSPAVMARTTQSVLVICEIGPANYYYRGVRLRDNKSIELANAVRSSDGFDVTNPFDGTRYEVRPTGISITSPGGQVSSEPMMEYAAR